MNAREWSGQDTNLPLGEMFAIAGTINTIPGMIISKQSLSLT